MTSAPDVSDARAEKPAYRVPSMAEIAAVDPNGYKLVSTFSGCGGSCLGFRLAGFQTLWASEFVDAARETYAANHPGVPIDARDIREVTAADILAATGLAPGDLDVLEGSPPCASFSTSGKREQHWGQVKRYSDTKQRTDDLFDEYIRLVDGLRPRIFVAENVSGLVKGTAKGIFIDMMKAMKARGYDVGAKLLDAQWLGVPQARRRMIFVGVRGDLGVAPAFPKPLPYRYSIRDALPWLSSVVHDTSGAWGAGEVADQPCPTTVGGVMSNACHFKVVGSTPEELAECDISRFAIGKEWSRLAPGQASERYFNLVRPSLNEPCPTVTQTGGNVGAASVTHPTERRKFTIAELRRICGFPDDFVLTGSYSQQWERLGRAVPPVMMSHVARAVLGVIQEIDAR
jgi:DNA (cytosine-5)-methyltransferase 1